MSMRTVMLEEVKRDPAAFVDGDNLAVEECICWEPFTRVGDLRELRCEEVTATRP